VNSNPIAAARDIVSSDSNNQWTFSTVLSEAHPSNEVISQFGLWALGMIAVLRLIGLIWVLLKK